jgi:hypothetical protein
MHLSTGLFAASLILGIGATAAARPAPKLDVHHAVDQRQGGWMARDANPKHPWLYVGSMTNNVVTAYDLGVIGNPLVRTITQGVSSPGGIALDAQGNLYVPNENTSTTTVYAPGSNTPSMILTGVDAPEAVAVDASGNIYICNRGSDPGIAIYPPGQTTPSQHLTSSLLTIPAQVAFDASGTLYISDNYTGISVLRPGPSQAVTSLSLQGLPIRPSGITIDPRNGKLFVSNSKSGANTIKLYPAGHTSPSRSKTYNLDDLDFLGVGTVKGRLKLFLPFSNTDVVYVLKPDLSGEPGIITTTSGYVATGVAFKPAGVP